MSAIETKDLIEEYEGLDRSAREAAGKGEEKERQLAQLRARRAALERRAGWGEGGKFAALDAQITDLEGAIADAKASFEGLRQRQGEIIAEGKALLEERFRAWADAEKARRKTVIEAAEELRRVLGPVADLTKQAEERRRELETLKGFVSAKAPGLGLPKPGSLSVDEIRALLRELQKQTGLDEPTEQETAAVAVIGAVARHLGL